MNPTAPEKPLEESAADSASLDRLRERLNHVLKGKAEVVENVLVCLLARGHILLEDRPGLGKTTLAKALAHGIGGRFARIQCTPDLLPSDITGFNIFDQKNREFEFRRGPVFSDILLADEINRATPRTQSALLEAMAERQVTVDAERYRLADEFFVIATQNPFDRHGTYPLPEAQLDRFAMKLKIGYPRPEYEQAMLAAAVGSAGEDGAEQREPLFEPGQLARMQESVAATALSSRVQEYLVQLAAASRRHADVSLGLSPRGLLTWQRTSQAWAALQGRDFVTPDDVQAVAHPVLAVRLGIEAADADDIITEILRGVEAPATP